MNLLRLLSLLVAIVAIPALPAGRAADALQLQSQLLVFKNSDFREVRADPAAGSDHRFGSLATIRFDQHTLVLQGSEFKWSPEDTAPKSITLLPVRPLRLGFNQPATIRCAAPAQYLEKQADGTYSLREIAADSPDAPRYLLTFLVEPGRAAANDLLVTCRTEIVTIRARDKLPGVDLEIGRPLLNVRRDENKLEVHKDEWAALLCRAPQENDYSVLTLLKISDDPAAPPRADAKTLPPTPTPQASPSAASPAVATIEYEGYAAPTAAGAKARQPGPGNPIPYLAYDGGFSELGAVIAGVKAPGAAEMSAAFRAVVEDKGYVPATALIPPAVVFVYHWGYCRSAPAGGYAIAGEVHANSFVIVSAYDFGDLARNQRTLLWRVGLHSGDPAPVTTALPALIGATGPFLGRKLVTRPGNRIAIASHEVDTAIVPSLPSPVAAGVVSALDDERVRYLIEQERRTLEWKHDLPMSDDVDPRPLRPPSKPHQ